MAHKQAPALVEPETAADFTRLQSGKDDAWYPPRSPHGQPLLERRRNASNARAHLPTFTPHGPSGMAGNLQGKSSGDEFEARFSSKWTSAASQRGHFLRQRILIFRVPITGPYFP